MDIKPLPLLAFAIADWRDWFVANDGKAFHADIASRWIFQRGVCDWNDMTDLPVTLREKLAQESPLLSSSVEKISSSSDGAQKLLIQYPDGALVEAVSMPGTKGNTICLSTQVGCPVACTFCASGAEGLERNLSCAEILEQVLWLQKECGDFGRVVIMGMGEVGLNLNAVLNSLNVLIDPKGANMAARRITLSTVAPPKALNTIATWGKQINVAISLHAANDNLRQELVPGIPKRSVRETLDEADQLFASNHREYTVEYVLLGDVNDSEDDARQLANILRGRRCHLNLIPYNQVDEFNYMRPSNGNCQAFAQITKDAGISTTLRRSLGGATDAACGQLRRRQVSEL